VKRTAKRTLWLGVLALLAAGCVDRDDGDSLSKTHHSYVSLHSDTADMPLILYGIAYEAEPFEREAVIQAVGESTVLDISITSSVVHPLPQYWTILDIIRSEDGAVELGGNGYPYRFHVRHWPLAEAPATLTLRITQKTDTRLRGELGWEGGSGSFDLLLVSVAELPFEVSEPNLYEGDFACYALSRVDRSIFAAHELCPIVPQSDVPGLDPVWTVLPRQTTWLPGSTASPPAEVAAPRRTGMVVVEHPEQPNREYLGELLAWTNGLWIRGLGHEGDRLGLWEVLITDNGPQAASSMAFLENIAGRELVSNATEGLALRVLHSPANGPAETSDASRLVLIEVDDSGTVSGDFRLHSYGGRFRVNAQLLDEPAFGCSSPGLVTVFPRACCELAGGEPCVMVYNTQYLQP
jgi:hypothetical protein